MNSRSIAKIRRELSHIRLHPHGRRAAELEAYAKDVGRELWNRGKEPTWVRKRDPSLSPPLSIPSHSKDMKAGTVRSIVDQLLSDCDDWEQFLMTEGDDNE